MNTIYNIKIYLKQIEFLTFSSVNMDLKALIKKRRLDA